MRWAMMIAGALLLVFGLAVWLEGVEVTRDRTVVDLGPVRAEVEEEQAIPRGVGGVAAVAGVALIVGGLAGRRT